MERLPELNNLKRRMNTFSNAWISILASRLIQPESFDYVAIATGNKRKNFAQVYVGHYRSSLPGQRIPMVLIVKCGNEDEKSEAKPGNRGKVCTSLITS
jgi:hypothetical protein